MNDKAKQNQQGKQQQHKRAELASALGKEGFAKEGAGAVSVRARYVTKELFEGFKKEACIFNRATAYARLEEMRRHALSLGNVETAHRIFRDQCKLVQLTYSGNELGDGDNGLGGTGGGGRKFFRGEDDIDGAYGGMDDFFVPPLPSEQDERLAAILTRAEAYARFEELRLMTMAKQKMEIARRIMVSQCRMMDLLAEPLASRSADADDGHMQKRASRQARPQGPAQEWKRWYRSPSPATKLLAKSIPSDAWFEEKMEELAMLKANRVKANPVKANPVKANPVKAIPLATKEKDAGTRVTGKLRQNAVDTGPSDDELLEAEGGVELREAMAGLADYVQHCVDGDERMADPDDGTDPDAALKRVQDVIRRLGEV